MSFGERLRSLRNEKKLTLRKLSEELNITYSALGKYERNEREPDFETLEKIASYFGVMIDYLIGRTDIKTQNELLFINSMRDLEEKIKELPSAKKKFVMSIVDSANFIINRNIDNDDIFLKTLSHIFVTLNTFNMGPRDTPLKKGEINNFLLSSTLGDLSTQNLLQYTSHYKYRINILMDELVNLHLLQNRNTSPTE
ncbi:hypothetical protein J5TS2_36870 [Brevibacillus halotolerans]|uniref:helix-turn-helix domain-containing protein n=1 Tax=Brevibacillus halotolerans TaxID=1507437 RepID=UPI001B12F975|nr:helix-turn-helix domain-containing protein [Brevibacillus halotolerans]GIO03019.1 hypothetical protein J5TS2_36870 [Brevibacillus halotolerans]